MDSKDILRIRHITTKEIMAIETLSVLAGTVATLHAASAVDSAQDSRTAIRRKKAGLKIDVPKPFACNQNMSAADRAAHRIKLALHKSLRKGLHIV